MEEEPGVGTADETHSISSSLIRSSLKLDRVTRRGRIGAKWRVSVGDATGPAKDGGIQKGDLLVAINDTTITDAAQ